MADPEVTSRSGLWHFHFPDEGILCTVSRLRQHTTHVSGEIVLTNNTDDPARHLHQANLNFSSTAAKAALAKALSAQRADVNWNALLEQIRVRVLTDFRAGEPLVFVGDLPLLSKPQYRLEPLCPEGKISSLYGSGGDGKTQMAILSLLCVQLGRSVGSLKPLQGNVALLDYENDWETTNATIVALRKGMGWPAPSPQGFVYRHCSQPLVDEIQEINEILTAHNVVFGVLDSVGMACVGEDTSASFDNVAIRLLRAVRSTKITWLLIDHRPHKEDKQFGSEYKRNEVRSQWSIRKTQEPDSSEMTVGLYHRKVNLGKLRKPFGLHFLYEGELGDPNFSFSVSPTEIKKSPELVEGLSKMAQVKVALEHGALSVDAIAEKAGLSPAYVGTTLSRGKAKGLFTQVSRGVWAIRGELPH